MSQGITSSTDPKIADAVRMSPSKTEITLGFQTMMCHMTRGSFPASQACVHQAVQAVVTEIQANVTLGVGGGGARALNKDPRGRGRDPLSLSNLDADDIVISYQGGSR